MPRAYHSAWRGHTYKHLLSLLLEPGTVPDSGGTKSTSYGPSLKCSTMSSCLLLPSCDLCSLYRKAQKHFQILCLI